MANNIACGKKGRSRIEFSMEEVVCVLFLYALLIQYLWGVLLVNTSCRGLHKVIRGALTVTMRLASYVR